MKKFIVPLMTVALVAALLLGCIPGAPVTPPPVTPPPVTPPEAPPYPMEGVAVKPDGTPYIFADNIIGMNEWSTRGDAILRSLINRAGGECTVYNADWDAELQHDIMEDLIEKGVDGIAILSGDPAMHVSAVDRAEDAGIPVVGWDMTIPSEKLTTNVTHDMVRTGFVAGQWLIDYAERNDKHLNVFELWGLFTMTGSHERHDGFHQAVDGHPLITVVEGPDCGWVEEKALDAVTNGFSANPDLNAVFSPGDYVLGTTQALQQLNRLFPAGDPNHVVFTTIDADPNCLDAMQKGWVDGASVHSPWELVDASVKALLTNVCCGLPVPKAIQFDTYFLDMTNIDQPRFGAPKTWGEMQAENFDLYPVLDISEYIETPTVEMKRPGY